MTTTLNEIDLHKGLNMTRYKEVRQTYGTIEYPTFKTTDPYSQKNDDPFQSYIQTQLRAKKPTTNTKPKHISVSNKTKSDKMEDVLSEDTKDTKDNKDTIDEDFMFLIEQQDTKKDTKKDAKKEVKEEEKPEEIKEEVKEEGGPETRVQTGGGRSPKRIVLTNENMMSPDKKKAGGEFLI